MTTWRPRKMLMTVGLQEQVLFPAGGRAIGASASSWSGGPRVTVWRAHISGGADQLGETRVGSARSEEHTSELQSQSNIVCRLLLEKKTSKEEVAAGETFP